VHVQGGQQGQGAVPDVLVLDPYRPAAPGRDGGEAAAASLDGRLGIDGQDPVAGCSRMPW
jgi:hypothetical protein